MDARKITIEPQKHWVNVSEIIWTDFQSRTAKDRGERKRSGPWPGGETQGKACTRASWGLLLHTHQRLIHLPVASARPPEAMSSTPPPPAGLLRNARATREGTFLFSRTQERQGFSAPFSLPAHFRQFTHMSQRWCRSHRTSWWSENPCLCLFLPSPPCLTPSSSHVQRTLSAGT